jgi:hypothetical protein
LLTLPIPSAPVFKISFTPDGTQLVASVPAGETQVYLPGIEDLFVLAQSRVTRTLTTEECQQYLHVEACPTEP